MVNASWFGSLHNETDGSIFARGVIAPQGFHCGISFTFEVRFAFIRSSPSRGGGVYDQPLAMAVGTH